MTFLEVRQGDALDRLSEISDKSVQTCVTSPPYWGLRDYGIDGQIGLEATPEEYVQKIVEVFREVWRVLRDDGTLWLNIGDSYSGSGKGPAGNLGATHNERHLEHKTGGIVPEGLKPKDLVGVPWRVAFALQKDGWYLRQDIIWHKPNPMPESVQDRCTKSHEYIFLLTKNSKYYFDNDAISEEANYKGVDRGGSVSRYEQNNFGGDNKQYDRRNKRSVWSISPAIFKEAHFATFPPEIPEVCIKAGSSKGDVVLDPFSGAGTTGMVAARLGRSYIGIELNPEYSKLSNHRIVDDCPLFNTVEEDVSNERETL